LRLLRLLEFVNGRRNFRRSGHYDGVLMALEDPDLILRGHRGSLIAVRGSGRGRYLAVVYRQVSLEDGFVITAYFTSRVDRRKAIWKG
jgi:hypothetical protein